MVTGLETFHEYFQNFSSDYVVIGGVACELALNSLQLDFRPTDDFDIVVVAENLTQGFGEKLKQFIHDGGYKVKLRKAMGNQPSFASLSQRKTLSHQNWKLRRSDLQIIGNGTLRH